MTTKAQNKSRDLLGSRLSGSGGCSEKRFLSIQRCSRARLTRSPPPIAGIGKGAGLERAQIHPIKRIARERNRLQENLIDFLDAVGFGFERDKGGFFAELALDLGPDFVARIFDGFEQAAGGLSNGFEVADERGAVGILGEELLQPGVLTDLSVAGGEEFGEIVFKLVGLQGVEADFVDVAGLTHFVASVVTSGWGGGLGLRSSSRSLRRALCSWDLLLPVEQSSIVAISLCSKPSTS